MSGKRRKLAKIAATINLLSELFSQAFAIPAHVRRPLKIDISGDIVRRIGTVINPRELHRAMFCYCRSVPYLRASMQPGAQRLDLDGNPVGVVTADEAEHARQTLVATLQAYMTRTAAKQVNKPKLETTVMPEKPEPASLADLRRAVQQRKSENNKPAQPKGPAPWRATTPERANRSIGRKEQDCRKRGG